MEWIDGNIGSKVTMKYPSIFLMGEHAKGETLSVAFAGPGQHQDAGAKMIHMAPYTSRRSSRSRSRAAAAVPATAARSGWTRTRTTRRTPCVATRSSSTPSPVRHVPGDRHPRRRRAPRPRGHGLEGERGAALLPHVPRPPRGRGHGHDRARLHRAHRASSRWSTRWNSTSSSRWAWKDRSARNDRRNDRAQPCPRPSSTASARTPTARRARADAFERFRSVNVEDFEPVTGREHEWKLSPVAAFAGPPGGELDGSRVRDRDDGCRRRRGLWIAPRRRPDRRTAASPRSAPPRTRGRPSARPSSSPSRRGREGRRGHLPRPRRRPAPRTP